MERNAMLDDFVNSIFSKLSELQQIARKAIAEHKRDAVFFGTDDVPENESAAVVKTAEWLVHTALDLEEDLKRAESILTQQQ